MIARLACIFIGALALPITHKYSQLVSGGLREKPRQSICRTA